MAKCERCGTEFHPWNIKTRFCRPECRIAAWKSKRSNIKSEFPEVVGYEYKPVNVLETDEEQRLIRESIAKKQTLTFEEKHYRPGDPEFDAIAKQCKPVGQIRNVSALIGLAHGRKDRWSK